MAKIKKTIDDPPWNSEIINLYCCIWLYVCSGIPVHVPILAYQLVLFASAVQKPLDFISMTNAIRILMDNMLILEFDFDTLERSVAQALFGKLRTCAVHENEAAFTGLYAFRWLVTSNPIIVSCMTTEAALISQKNFGDEKLKAQHFLT
ncbi:hypothetical protein STEG23_005067, partial [Scotinomys teguina]